MTISTQIKHLIKDAETSFKANALDSAELQLMNALKLSDFLEFDLYIKSDIYNNLGLIYKLKNDFDKAFFYYEESLFIKNQIYSGWNERSLVITRTNLEQCYIDFGEYVEHKKTTSLVTKQKKRKKKQKNDNLVMPLKSVSKDDDLLNKEILSQVEDLITKGDITSLTLAKNKASVLPSDWNVIPRIELAIKAITPKILRPQDSTKIVTQISIEYEVSDFTQITTLIAFSLKEALELSYSVSYFFTEILHIDYVLPTWAQNISFVPSIFAKTALYYATCAIGLQPFLEGEYKYAHHLASIFYAVRLAFDWHLQDLRSDLLTRALESKVSNKEILPICLNIVTAEVAGDILKEIITKTTLPALQLSIPAITIHAAVNAIECYRVLNTEAAKKTNSIFSQIAPYVADAVMLGYHIVNGLNINNNHNPNLITKMFYVRQGFVILNSIVICHYTTKLLAQTIEEFVIDQNYIGEIYDTWGLSSVS